jgi:hypothetical protein
MTMTMTMMMNGIKSRAHFPLQPTLKATFFLYFFIINVLGDDCWVDGQSYFLRRLWIHLFAATKSELVGIDDDLGFVARMTDFAFPFHLISFFNHCVLSHRIVTWLQLALISHFCRIRKWIKLSTNTYVSLFAALLTTHREFVTQRYPDRRLPSVEFTN